MNSKIVLSPKEEMSILEEGDFDQNSYSKIIRIALSQSLAINTKLPDWIKFMPGMSGKKYRYFINNLVAMIDKPKYLEIGSWSGSTACSAIYDNELTVLCIDNWSQFNENDNEHKSYGVANPKEAFESNIKKVISKKQILNLLKMILEKLITPQSANTTFIFLTDRMKKKINMMV